MNSIFNWLKDSGTQAMLILVGTAVGIASMTFAALAAWFAWKAPTKKDLARVESNTAHLKEVRTGISSMNDRLKKQEDAEGFQIRANRVSITATGNQSGNVPYPLYLSIKESKEQNLLLTHLELYNEQGTSFGSFPCSKTGNTDRMDLQAAIPVKNMNDWFRGGTPVQTTTRMRLKLRVWMSMDGVEGSRDMAVLVIESVGSGYPGFVLEGNV